MSTKNGLLLGSLTAFICLVTACEKKEAVETESNYVDDKIAELQQVYAPDKRVAVFQIEAKTDGDNVTLIGETNLPEARLALLDSLEQNEMTVTDSIVLMPSPILNNKLYGLVNNSVANIRSKPSHSAELATQALLGMPLNVLKQEGEWYLVQTPDKYISWVDHGGLVLLDAVQFDEWKNADKIIYQRVAGFSYSKPDESSQVVSDLVMGDVLVVLDDYNSSFFEAVYPDGRKAYVSKKEASSLDAWLQAANPTGENLTGVAMQLMGAPYLWGGTSSKGMDCSGFTKTIYFMNGLVIPRDASQQVNAGTPVNTDENWDNMQVGDLLFFGTPATPEKKERVVHVGMWIGDHQFIHASGKVRISSFDPNSKLYDSYNANRFLRARRYAPNFEGSILNIKEGLLY